MSTKICMENLNLEDYCTIVLKPISRKVLKQIKKSDQVYHLRNFKKTKIEEVPKKRSDGGEYTLIKTFGTGSLATTFDKKDGKVKWNHNGEIRNVMIMGVSDPAEGLYVCLDDIMAAKAPVIMTAGLTASAATDDNDE